MVGTIMPVGDRKNVTIRDRLSVSFLFLVGSVTGGAILGLVSGTIGEILVVRYSSQIDIYVYLAMAGVVVLGALVEIGVFRLRVPTISRQVPARWWMTYDWRLAGYLSGLQLGAGVLTRVVWPGLYIAIALNMLLGIPGSILVAGAFGLVRGMQPMFVLIASHVRRVSWDRVTESHVQSLMKAQLRLGGMLVYVALIALQMVLVW